MRNKFTLTLVSLAITLVSAELFLRYGFGGLYTYSEKASGLSYQSPFTPFLDSRYLEYPPNKEIQDKRLEFNYTYKSNSLGIFDRNLTVETPDTLLRILCIGDSFTQGIGAPQDSSWPRALEHYLHNHGLFTEVWNAGLQGSDPIYATTFMKEVILDSLNPDVVILAMNSTDPFEVALRGGQERFSRSDGRVNWRRPPWWEPLYARSHFIRLFVHAAGYNSYLLHEKHMSELLSEANEAIDTAMFELSLEVEKRQGRLWIIEHPKQDEIHDKPEQCLVQTLDTIGSVSFISMSKLFAQDARLTTHTERYFWPVDGHHNSEGYWLFGELLADNLVGDPQFVGLVEKNANAR